MTRQFQKGEVVKNGEVAEIVEVAKIVEAASIAGAICDTERSKISLTDPPASPVRLACLAGGRACARAMAGRREVLNKKDRFGKGPDLPSF
jgi:hypothetical protein